MGKATQKETKRSSVFEFSEGDEESPISKPTLKKSATVASKAPVKGKQQKMDAFISKKDPVKDDDEQDFAVSTVRTPTPKKGTPAKSSGPITKSVSAVGLGAKRKHDEASDKASESPRRGARMKDTTIYPPKSPAKSPSRNSQISSGSSFSDQLFPTPSARSQQLKASATISSPVSTSPVVRSAPQPKVSKKRGAPLPALSLPSSVESDLIPNDTVMRSQRSKTEAKIPSSQDSTIPPSASQLPKDPSFMDIVTDNLRKLEHHQGSLDGSVYCRLQMLKWLCSRADEDQLRNIHWKTIEIVRRITRGRHGIQILALFLRFLEAHIYSKGEELVKAFIADRHEQRWFDMLTECLNDLTRSMTSPTYDSKNAVLVLDHLIGILSFQKNYAAKICQNQPGGSRFDLLTQSVWTVFSCITKDYLTQSQQEIALAAHSMLRLLCRLGGGQRVMACTQIATMINTQLKQDGSFMPVAALLQTCPEPRLTVKISEVIIHQIFHSGKFSDAKSATNGGSDLVSAVKYPAKLSARRRDLFGVLVSALMNNFARLEKANQDVHSLEHRTYMKLVHSLRERLSAADTKSDGEDDE